MNPSLLANLCESLKDKMKNKALITKGKPLYKAIKKINIYYKNKRIDLPRLIGFI